MKSYQKQQRLSNNPPLLPLTISERELYQKCFKFEFGKLDDGTHWIRTPSKGLFNVDWLTLRLILELDAGAPITPLCKKYKIDTEEIASLLGHLQKEGAIVRPREGKITRALYQEDISLVPYIFLFFILAAIQIEYFQHVAVSYRFRHWYEALVIGILSLLPVVIHEVGHYLSSRSYFPPRIGFTFLWLFPAVYVDTHASWCLPRNIRLLINSAGMLMDLGINTLLVLLVLLYPSLEYFITPLLILQYTRWSIILNPLVAGDGYWLLSDFSRTINLRKKGRDSLQKKRFHWLSLYGLLSILFTAFSILGILWFVLNLIGLGLRLG